MRPCSVALVKDDSGYRRLNTRLVRGRALTHPGVGTPGAGDEIPATFTLGAEPRCRRALGDSVAALTVAVDWSAQMLRATPMKWTAAPAQSTHPTVRSLWAGGAKHRHTCGRREALMVEGTMKVTRPKKASGGKPADGRLSLLAAGVGLPHPDKVRAINLEQRTAYTHAETLVVKRPK